MRLVRLGLGEVLPWAPGVTDPRAAAMGRSRGRGPAGSRSNNKGAARSPLPPTSVPARPGARRPAAPAGSGFPSAEFREVSGEAR